MGVFKIGRCRGNHAGGKKCLRETMAHRRGGGRTGWGKIVTVPGGRYISSKLNRFCQVAGKFLAGRPP